MSRAGRIVIIDHSVGNVQSVYNAFRALNAEPKVIESPDQLDRPDGIVLPGVGSFPDGMNALIERGFVGALEEEVHDRGVPLLGVCLGLQLLAERGSEREDREGLGWLPGTVERLQPAEGYEVPHMGWNNVSVGDEGVLFSELADDPSFYFVHSYQFVPLASNEEVVTSYT